jgi:hypothetical protein
MSVSDSHIKDSTARYLGQKLLYIKSFHTDHIRLRNTKVRQN